MDELKIRDEISAKEKEIIKDYWEQSVDGTFARKPTVFAKKLRISLNDIHKLVRDNSKFIIDIGNCKGCNTLMQETVTSHTAYNAAKIYRERECEKCGLITKQKKEEEQRVQREREQERALEYARIREAEEKNLKAEIKEISSNPDKDFELQTKHNLSLEELKILILIIKYKSKDLIYRKVFNGDPQNRAIWATVNKLERKGLLRISRYDNHSVKDFIDTHDLSTVLSASGMTFTSRMNSLTKESNDLIPIETKNSSSILRFSLAKTDKQINSNQPNYGGTFRPNHDVVLKEGVLYIYGGWINNDGSISLNIQPYSEYIKRPEQTTFDVESKETQDQIIKLRNNEFDDTY